MKSKTKDIFSARLDLDKTLTSFPDCLYFSESLAINPVRLARGKTCGETLHTMPKTRNC